MRLHNNLSNSRKIADFIQKIEISEFFKQSIELLTDHSTTPSIKQIVCFGIGRIRHCIVSRYQLAYILALRSHLEVATIQFHEPLLTHQHDTELLNALDCELIATNCEGKLNIDSTTLAFLPHCPKQLINNLLWKNWSADALQHIILIGNSFASIVQQTPVSCIAQDAGFISRIEPYTSEFTLRNSFEHRNVFNDTAIHFFNTERCEANIFDDFRSEPTYDLSELIETTDRLSIH